MSPYLHFSEVMRFFYKKAVLEPPGSLSFEQISPTPKQRIIETSLWVYIPILVISIVWIVLNPRQAPSLWNSYRSLFYAIAYTSLIVMITQFLRHRIPDLRKLEDHFYQVLKPINTKGIILLSLLSGMGEELLFRGLLQSYLGLWPTAVLFALFHFPSNRVFLYWSLFAFAVGLLFGLHIDGGGDLTTVILAHSAINAINMKMIFDLREGTYLEG